VLRWVVHGLAAAPFLGAAIAVGMGAPWASVAWLLAVGAFLVLGVWFERVHYKLPVPRPPGAGWVATPERFVDPGTGHLIEVHVRPETGERAYVDLGKPAP
jgi:hypothetical protein